MPKGTVIKPKEVVSFFIDETYSSKMLLDDTNSQSKNVQINEGTIGAGKGTHGATHAAPFDEIYIIMDGSAVLHMDGLDYDMEKGDIAFIPGDTFHSITNKSDTEDLIIYTVWPVKPIEGVNEVYDKRLKDWGKTYKTIYEEVE